MKIEESVVINRSAGDVFAFFSDRANDAKWMSSVTESAWMNPEEATGVGRRGRMVLNAMGQRSFEDVVTEYEHGRHVAHRSVSDRMIFTSSCTAIPEGDRCRAVLTYEPERLPGGALGRLMEPVTSRVVRKNYRADLRRLKEILEAEAD